jgi:hypothetical protein
LFRRNLDRRRPGKAWRAIVPPGLAAFGAAFERAAAPDLRVERSRRTVSDE